MMIKDNGLSRKQKLELKEDAGEPVKKIGEDYFIFIHGIKRKLTQVNCLGESCTRQFMSVGPYNRICSTCRKRNSSIARLYSEAV